MNNPTSKAKLVLNNFNSGLKRHNFCLVTLRRKTAMEASKVVVTGDDTTYTFSDGSMVHYRGVVKEFQLLKG